MPTEAFARPWRWIVVHHDPGHSDEVFRDTFDTQLNHWPYRGEGEPPTAHYGAMEGVDAIQIEMCQRLYMEEGQPDGAPETPAFDDARQRLRRVLDALVQRLR